MAASKGAAAASAAAAAGVSLPPPTTTVPLPPLRREARSTSLASMDCDVGVGGATNGGNDAPSASVAASAANGLGRGPPPTWDRNSLPARPQGLSVALKMAGVHWWYRHPSHAAELTGERSFLFPFFRRSISKEKTHFFASPFSSSPLNIIPVLLPPPPLKKHPKQNQPATPTPGPRGTPTTRSSRSAPRRTWG